MWPRWLPIQARLPLIAQITAAIALIAAVTMPRWSEVPTTITPAPAALAAEPAVVIPAPLPRPVDPVPAAVKARPAHLNLDVRHSFKNVDLSVTVDGRSVLETRLEGSGRRFGVIGKRAERGYTRTLDVAPGVRVVRVRVRAPAEKFDQTRVERFDLDSAAVASMRVAADRSGLSIVAERPPVSPPAAAPLAPAPPVAAQTASVLPQVMPTAQAQAAHVAQTAQAVQEASAIAEVYQTLRSTLIAMFGFIASAATGFLVESYLRSRRAFAFAQQTAAQEAAALTPERRRRRRAGKPPQTPAVTSP